jgi:hypothetical protein
LESPPAQRRVIVSFMVGLRGKGIFDVDIKLDETNEWLLIND